MKTCLITLVAGLFANIAVGYGGNIAHCSEPANFQFYAQQLIQYHDNGSYAAQIKRVTDKAETYLARRITERAHNNALNQKKLAVMIDIDETALSNYDAIKLWLQGVNNVGDTLSPYIIKKLKNFWSDPAIQPVLSLYQKAVKNNIAVFFVTGRTATDRLKTKTNLENVGYDKYEKLIMRTSHQRILTARDYKNKEADDIVKQGYDLVLAIGDQYSDLPNAADRKYKLPNPFYYIA